MLTFDYETEGIEGNPIHNPPKPVGVSIQEDGASEYLAWGHPTENNCTFEEGRARLLSAIERNSERLAHNAPFESAVTKKWLGIDLQRDRPESLHDTQYLLFLADPYANTFSLKPSAERVLGLPPDEQQELKDWILRNVSESKESNWGAYICRAPGGLVGKYAGNSKHTGVPGDTDRTLALFNALMPRIENIGMTDAYRREQQLMPILFRSSERGVRVDMERLRRDIPIYRQAQKICDDYIRSRLGDFNIDSDRELAEALDKHDMVTEWVLTPTGRRSTSRKNLAGRIKDAQLLQVMGYRGVLETCLGTFAEKWLEQAEREGGRVHPQWNQVRGDRGSDGDISGTRTGRMSCKGPNLQNPPTDFENLAIPSIVKEFLDAQREAGWIGYDVPHMRVYLLPDEGCVWLKRDFSAQEMRIMAHFAEGKLFEAFRKDPKTDPHGWVSQTLRELLGINLTRKQVKIIGFSILYGSGVAKLSAGLDVDEVRGKEFRDAYYSLLPEIRQLSYDVRNRGKRGQFIRTWGGRVYFREPDPARDLSYKLLNYLIQGSAADQTKQSLIDHDQNRSQTDILLAAVHDEINISAPIGDDAGAMRRLRESMNADRFDVPFLSEGYRGPNWADIVEYDA